MPLFNPPLVIQDEGTPQGSVSTVNFTGSAVTASVTGDVATVNVTAGGSGNFVQATVNFGGPTGGVEETTAVVTVTGQAWVTPSSIILCSVFAGTTADHDPEDAVVEQLTAYAANIVAGTGFDIYVSAPEGAWGRYLVNASGV
jgi:hypothetical protein